jgi:hypothetical protein
MAETKAAPAPAPEAKPLSGIEGELVRIESKRRILKKTVQDMKTERDTIKAELDALKAKPADPTAVQLRAELRELKHKAVFDRIASELKARPEGLEDLWKLSGYVPEADAPDEAKIKELVTAQVKERAYLFDGAAPEAKPGEKPKQEPGPGASRGGLVRDSGKFQVRRKGPGSMRDPEWMRLNQAEYNKQMQAGNVEIID